MTDLKVITLACIATTITSSAYAQPECPFGYFKIGPLSANRSIGGGLPSQVTGTACIKLDTNNEQLAIFDAVVIADMSRAQALVDRIVTNLGSATKKCTSQSGWADYEIAISTATLESGLGTPHFTVTGTAKACAITQFPVSFTLNMPMQFVVTPQQSLVMTVDRPTSDLPVGVNALVSAKIYRQAQAYAKVFRIDLTRVAPKEVFLFNPQIGDVTASYGNDSLSARVSLTARITSAAATKAINDRLNLYVLTH